MADNLGYTPGAGATIATDEVDGIHYQVIKPAFGPDGVGQLVADNTPLPVKDGESRDLLRSILQMLMAPLGYDKSLGRQRSTAVIESGTVTTVSTLANITAIAGYSAQMQVLDTNRTAWEQCVRSRIT